MTILKLRSPYLFILTFALTAGLLLASLGCAPAAEDEEFYDDEPAESEFEPEPTEFVEIEEVEVFEPTITPIPELEPTAAVESESGGASVSMDGVALDSLATESGLVAGGPSFFQDGTCPVDAALVNRYSLRCGTLFVPENREVEGSQMIQLAVLILPADSGNPAPDPVIYLEGGPGGSAISGFEDDPDGWAQYGFTQNRDLILFDQRGTGYSIPELDCDTTGNFSAEDIARNCKADLEAAGIDLAAYNTVENAADVADLAQTLGHDQYNLLGISYGTRLALAVMRDHPDGVRSVVLDSPFPPNANPAETEAGLAWNRFERLFEACADDSACVAAYPDLEQLFLDTVDLMNEEPIEDVYGDDLVAVVQQMMFGGSNYIFLIPLLINQAADGDLDLFFELEPELFGMGPSQLMLSSLRQGMIADGETDGDAVGMYNSVMCHDEFAFASFIAADEKAAQEVPDQVYYGLFGTTIDTFTTCDIWDVGSADDFVDEPVFSEIPTLVLVGEFDPSTPPEWGQLTVDSLSNGYLVELPGDGHSLVAQNGCAIGLMDRFFETPTAPDTGCLAEIEPLFFELPEP